MDLKIGKEYVIKTKFLAKKFSSFGSYSKFMGIKITENFTEADLNTQSAFEVFEYILKL